MRDTAKNVVGLLLGLNRELYYNQGFRNSNILWKYPLTFPVSKMDMAHRGACRHRTLYLDNACMWFACSC